MPNNFGSPGMMTHSSDPGVSPREEPSHVLQGAVHTEALESTVADDQDKEALVGFLTPEVAEREATGKQPF